MVKIRVYRPFPEEAIKIALSGIENLVVVERDHLFSPAMALSADLRTIYYSEQNKPKIFGYCAGLGGRDMSLKEWEKIYYDAKKASLEGRSIRAKWWDLRP